MPRFGALIPLIEFLDDETIASDDEIESNADGKDTADDEIESSADGKGTADGNDEEDADWNSYLDRARIRGRREGALDEAHDIENRLPFVTKPDDYPLWRITCRVCIFSSIFREIHSDIRFPTGRIGI